jgi:hypothetical protein
MVMEAGGTEDGPFDTPSDRKTDITDRTDESTEKRFSAKTQRRGDFLVLLKNLKGYVSTLTRSHYHAESALDASRLFEHLDEFASQADGLVGIFVCLYRKPGMRIAAEHF